MTRFILIPKKNKDTQEIAAAMKRHNKKVVSSTNAYAPTIVDMSRKEAVQKNLTKLITNNSIIEIHAEGRPWDLGMETCSKYDFSPFSLAAFFNENLPQINYPITIELHCCNSGTFATGTRGTICFAKDFSAALAILGRTNITVVGYAGYVHSEKYLRQSVVSEPEKHGAKVSHCSLAEASLTYRDGQLVTSAKKTLVDYSYTEADIKADLGLTKYFLDKTAFELEQHMANLRLCDNEIEYSNKNIICHLLSSQSANITSITTAAPNETTPKSAIPTPKNI